MKSFRDDLIDRMKTGWGRFVLASYGPLKCSTLRSIGLPRDGFGEVFREGTRV